MTTPYFAPIGLIKNLPEKGHIGIAWSGVGLSFLFVVARTVIRLTKVGRLDYDDYWIYVAWVLLAVNAVLETLQTPHLYYVAMATAGLVPLDETLLYHGNLFVRYEFAIIGLFWTVLWAVKASFLTLFWRLFDGLPMFRKTAVAIAIFAFLAFVGCWIASILNCHPASLYFKFGQCNKPIDLRGTEIAIIYSTTVDIVTDVLIMAMPFVLLYKVQITFRQKVGLAAVFGLATIIIITAIVRAIEITTKARADVLLLSLWSIIESSIAVIVGCLPPFKALFTSRFSSSNHYNADAVNSHTIGSKPNRGSRHNSIPLNSLDDGYLARAKGGLDQGFSDGESQEMIIRTNEEMGDVVMGSKDIKVERVFVSSKLSFLEVIFERPSKIPIFLPRAYTYRAKPIHNLSFGCHTSLKAAQHSLPAAALEGLNLNT